jgi:hypothetical protein
MQRQATSILNPALEISQTDGERAVLVEKIKYMNIRGTSSSPDAEEREPDAVGRAQAEGLLPQGVGEERRHRHPGVLPRQGRLCPAGRSERRGHQAFPPLEDAYAVRQVGCRKGVQQRQVGVPPRVPWSHRVWTEIARHLGALMEQHIVADPAERPARQPDQAWPRATAAGRPASSFIIAMDPLQRLLDQATQAGLLHRLDAGPVCMHTRLYSDNVAIIVVPVVPYYIVIQSLWNQHWDVKGQADDRSR